MSYLTVVELGIITLPFLEDGCQRSLEEPDAACTMPKLNDNMGVHRDHLGVLIWEYIGTI